MNTRQHNITLTNLDTSEVKENVRIAGWENITERLFRSPKYFAVNLNQTLPIRFPRQGGRTYDYGGYYWIADAKEIRGVKTRIQVDIQILNNNTGGYDDSFTGVLDLRPTGGYNQQDEFIECKILDSGKFAKFSARDEIDYNVFDLVSSDNVTVPNFLTPYIEATYKPIDIYLNCESSGDMSVGTTFLTNGVPFNLGYLGNISINEIGDRISIGEPRSDLVYTNSLDEDTELKINISEGALSITIDITYAGSVLPSVVEYSFELTLNLYNSGGGLKEENIIADGGFTQGVSPGDPTFSTTLSIPLSELNQTFDLLEGEYIEFKTTHLYNVGFEPSNVNIRQTYDLDFLNLVEKTEGEPENQIKGMYPFELMSRLIQLMTSTTNIRLIESTILGRTDSEFVDYVSDGVLSREFVTNGFQLRQFVDRALNVNFRDSFKSLNAIHPIGVWYDKINDWFQIEDIEQFYLSELYSFDLGQVKDIKTTDYTKLYFNKIKTGYPKTEYEDFGGVNETNTQTEHEISIEEKQTYDIRSPYFGDSIGQELARRKNKKSFASEDTKYDNNVYLTTLNTSNETIQGDLDNLEGFEGISQYYNLTKTPRQNLQRHFKVIQAPLYKDINEIFTFRNSVKDTNISYTDPERSTLVNEFDNLEQYAVTNNLIDPEIDEFQGIINDSMANEIVNNPHKIIQYLDREGNRKYGYIIELEFNRYKKEAKYKLVKTNANRVP